VIRTLPEPRVVRSPTTRLALIHLPLIRPPTNIGLSMPPNFLALASAWALVALGVAHIAFGMVKYRTPLRDALKAGFIAQFSAPESRRIAFWFVLFGFPLLLAGHLAVHAAVRGDLETLGLVAGHVMVISLIGVAAFPRSPFAVSLAVSALLMLAGHGF